MPGNAAQTATALPLDRVRFAELEQVIERGFSTFVEVGKALIEIQQGKLYRASGHRTFAEYAAMRWDFSRAHAYRQIEASRVIDILSPIGDSRLPATEAQARELARLVDDPEAMREVWREANAAAEGRVTARDLHARVMAKGRDTKPNSESSNPAPQRRRQCVCPECGHEWSR